MPLSKKFRPWLLGLALFAGCNQFQDCIDEQVTACCNKHKAKMAWCACRPNYIDCQENLWDFGVGFRQGYEDVLAGRSTCGPAFPPRSYWSICYQNDSGRCAVAAFYDGYHHGVAVALADGYGGYGELPCSSDMYKKCCKGPVSIDIDAYKTAHSAQPTPALSEEGVPPIPDIPMEIQAPTGIPGANPPAAAPYSPGSLPAPPEEKGPMALIEPPLPVQ